MLTRVGWNLMDFSFDESTTTLRHNISAKPCPAIAALVNSLAVIFYHLSLAAFTGTLIYIPKTTTTEPYLPIRHYHAKIIMIMTRHIARL
jgi:hypothetical protein